MPKGVDCSFLTSIVTRSSEQWRSSDTNFARRWVFAGCSLVLNSHSKMQMMQSLQLYIAAESNAVCRMFIQMIMSCLIYYIYSCFTCTILYSGLLAGTSERVIGQASTASLLAKSSKLCQDSADLDVMYTDYRNTIGTVLGTLSQ